jgi:hypothetical protein
VRAGAGFGLGARCTKFQCEATRPIKSFPMKSANTAEGAMHAFYMRLPKCIQRKAAK